jgi:hypothetical protein
MYGSSYLGKRAHWVSETCTFFLIIRLIRVQGLSTFSFQFINVLSIIPNCGLSLEKKLTRDVLVSTNLHLHLLLSYDESSQ